MKHRFRYSYYDLGEREAGDQVIVSLSGRAAGLANVLLLDERNFGRYRGGMEFEYLGGQRHRSPVELSVPRDGHWYVAMDLGGRRGRVRGAVKVVPSSPDSDQPLQTATKSSAASKRRDRKAKSREEIAGVKRS
jgi:hypothetical protein